MVLLGRQLIASALTSAQVMNCRRFVSCVAVAVHRAGLVICRAILQTGAQALVCTPCAFTFEVLASNNLSRCAGGRGFAVAGEGFEFLAVQMLQAVAAVAAAQYTKASQQG